MITDRQKKSIIASIDRMKDGEVVWLNEYLEEEREYIIFLMERQTGIQGYCIESNGTAQDKKTITKIRKRYVNYKSTK